MNGLLRRLKRSRAAVGGDPPPASGTAPPDLDASPSPDFARPGADDGSADDGHAGAVRPATDDVPPATHDAPPITDDAPPTPPPGVLAPPPLGGHGALEPVAAPAKDPAVPAGLDPAEAAARPPAGRRGKLRRRLRYLRRARELMLRDLGGLVYEVHRTGGGDLPAHAGLLGAKVERLAALDAEAHALSTALAVPREQAILFEPGIGGMCAACGELYGADARFCWRCGTATSEQPVRESEPEAPASERAPTLVEPYHEPVAPVPEPPPEPAAPGAEAPTSVLPADRGEPATESLPVARDVPAEPPARDGDDRATDERLAAPEERR